MSNSSARDLRRRASDLRAEWERRERLPSRLRIYAGWYIKTGEEGEAEKRMAIVQGHIRMLGKYEFLAGEIAMKAVDELGDASEAAVIRNMMKERRNSPRLPLHVFDALVDHSVKTSDVGKTFARDLDRLGYDYASLMEHLATLMEGESPASTADEARTLLAGKTRLLPLFECLLRNKHGAGYDTIHKGAGFPGEVATEKTINTNIERLRQVVMKLYDIQKTGSLFRMTER